MQSARRFCALWSRGWRCETWQDVPGTAILAVVLADRTKPRRRAQLVLKRAEMCWNRPSRRALRHAKRTHGGRRVPNEPPPALASRGWRSDSRDGGIVARRVRLAR